MELLFDITPEETQGAHSVEWSFSRRQVLFQCPRKYYYQYFGSSRRSADAEPQKALLRELRKLSNFNLLAGEVLDLAVRNYLHRAASGDVWGLGRLERYALDIFDADIQYNRVQHSTSLEESPHRRLLEYYLAFSDVAEREELAKTKLLVALKNFLSPEFEFYRHNGGKKDAVIQENVSVTIDDCPARGRLDLAFHSHGEYHIVDWKIGADAGSEEYLQVGFYGLWASRRLVSTTPIHLGMAYLGDNRLKRYRLEDVDPRIIKARITQDLLVMRDLEHFGKSANYKAFTPCLQPKICRMCAFQTVCFLKDGL